MRKPLAKALTLIAAAALCVGMLLPISALADSDDLAAGNTEVSMQAQTDEKSGTWGGCSWSLGEDGTLTVRPGNAGDVSAAPWKTLEGVKAVVFSADGGKVVVSTCNGLFQGLSNVSSIDLSGLDTSAATDMSVMFQGCFSLKTLNLSGLNTSNVRDIHSMFKGCTALESLNLSGLDMSAFKKVSTDAVKDVFGGCSSLRTINARGMKLETLTAGIFRDVTSLESLDLSNADTSNVTDMGSMFQGCSSLKSLNLSGLNTSNVTTMSFMFQGCSSLTSLNLSGFNTSKVTSMGNMFQGCSSLESLNLSGLNTSSVQAMYSMFDGCSKLESLDVSSFDTSNATSMTFMFQDCSSLTSLDLSGFYTPKVTSMGNMFSGCSKLTFLDVSGLDTSNAESFGDLTFEDCESIEKFVVGERTILRNFPNSSRGKWRSEKDHWWFDNSEILTARQGIADVYVTSFEPNTPITDKSVTISWASGPFDDTDCPVTPNVRLTCGGQQLLEDVDYTVRYENNDKAGTGKAFVTGMGDFTGETSKEFTIYAAQGSVLRVYTASSKSDENPVLVKRYTREELNSLAAVNPISMNFGSVSEAYTTLTGVKTISLVDLFADAGITWTNGCTAAGIDYTAYYTDYQDPAENPTKSNPGYTQQAWWFPNLGNDAGIDVSGKERVYPHLALTAAHSDGFSREASERNIENAQELDIPILMRGVSYKSASKDDLPEFADDSMVEVKNLVVTIPANSLEGAVIKCDATATWTGKPIEPEVTVFLGDTKLQKGTDYDVTYKNNVDIGTATVTVTATRTGRYIGSKTTTFQIEAIDISNATVALSPTSYAYDGNAKEPAVTVKLGDVTLMKDTDYTVVYTNNVDVGMGTAWVRGMGSYTGTVTGSFKIGSISIATATVTVSPTSYTYDGVAKEPAVTVKLGSTTLTKDKDYTVSYSNNTAIGIATATVTGVGNYIDTAKATFTIKAAPETVWRLYDTTTGEHHYTKDANEREVLLSWGNWNDEGTAWVTPTTSSTPVYRVYDLWTGEHHYTSDKHEQEVLVGSGRWRDEGIAWYSDDDKTVTVYRLERHDRGPLEHHHYTLDTKERSVCLNEWGWNDEGIGWYALSAK